MPSPSKGVAENTTRRATTGNRRGVTHSNRRPPAHPGRPRIKDAANLKQAVEAIEKVHRKVLTKHPRLGTSSSLRKALTAAATAKPRLMPRPSSAPARSATKKSKEGGKDVFSYTNIYGDKKSKPLKNITGMDMFEMQPADRQLCMLKKGV